MGALAEFERDLIRERTNAGLAAARAKGRIGGRPRKRQRPTGTWRWLDRCLPIRVIPSQRSGQPWGSPAPLCIDTSKRLNRSP